MTNSELRIEIAKLEEQKINFCDNNLLFNQFTALINEIKIEIHKDSKVALKALGFGER